MIKTAIIGDTGPDSGELLRLLLLHPDVEVTAVYAGLEPAGHPVSRRFRGLDGETSLTFAPAMPDMSKLDMIFLTGTSLPSTLDFGNRAKVVNMTDTPADGWVFGLPELNRKALVRGAMRANVPSHTATAVVTPLLPLARNLMLNAPVGVEIETGENDASFAHGADGEIAEALQSLQTSFDAPVNITRTSAATRRRGTNTIIDITTGVPLEQIRGLYDDYFDDHNLVHIVDRRADATDLLGTSKMLISLSAPAQGTIRINAAMDGVLKGRIGQAVHVMNLLAGLHEKTGLQLLPWVY